MNVFSFGVDMSYEWTAKKRQVSVLFTRVLTLVALFVTQPQCLFGSLLDSIHVAGMLHALKVGLNGLCVLAHGDDGVGC